MVDGPHFARPRGRSANENGARRRRFRVRESAYAATRWTLSASPMRSTAFLMLSMDVAKEMRR